MLLNLNKKNWTHGLTLQNFTEHSEANGEDAKVSHAWNAAAAMMRYADTHTLALVLQKMLALAEAYNKSVQEELTMTPEQLKTRHVGKQDPKRHLEDAVEKVMGDNIVMALGSMIDSVSF